MLGGCVRRRAGEVREGFLYILSSRLKSFGRDKANGVTPLSR